jgi:hypothetical protein
MVVGIDVSALTELAAGGGRGGVGAGGAASLITIVAGGAAAGGGGLADAAHCDNVSVIVNI